MTNIHHGKRSLARFLAYSTVPALIACAASSNPRAAASPPLTDDIVVAVSNHTLARLRVHAKYGAGEPIFLGEVSTNRTRSFMMPWNDDELRIGVRRADATVTDPRWSNNALTVSPGDSLEFSLTANARRTAQVVFRKVGNRRGL